MLPKKYSKGTQKVTILPISAKWYLIFEDFIKKRTATEYAAVHKKPKAAHQLMGDF